MDFLIADIRIDLPDELFAGRFARALAPFAGKPFTDVPQWCSPTSR